MRDGIVRRTKSYRASPAMVVSLIALFVALGGTSYAALKLPANSVGSAQVINGSLQTADLAKKTAAALKGKPGRQGPQGPPGASGAAGAPGPAGKDGSNATINGVAAGGDLAGTFPNPLIANGAVTGPKVADGTLKIADLSLLKQTATIDVPSIPASSCTGFSLIHGGTKPGDIAFAFAPLDLSDELVLPPSMFDTAGETPLKICNVGATALDPPSMTYTVYTIAG
jgi:hypothetical protein